MSRAVSDFVILAYWVRRSRPTIVFDLSYAGLIAFIVKWGGPPLWSFIRSLLNEKISHWLCPTSLLSLTIRTCRLTLSYDGSLAFIIKRTNGGSCTTIFCWRLVEWIKQSLNVIPACWDLRSESASVFWFELQLADDFVIKLMNRSFSSKLFFWGLLSKENNQQLRYIDS